MISENEVEKLASLSRLELNENEKKNLTHDMGSILSYIDKLKKAPADLSARVEPIANVNNIREDEVRHEPGSFTEKLLSEAPKREGQYVAVKKIL